MTFFSKSTAPHILTFSCPPENTLFEVETKKKMLNFIFYFFASSAEPNCSGSRKVEVAKKSPSIGSKPRKILSDTI